MVNNRTGGGVAAFCKHGLNPVRLSLPEHIDDVEAVCIDFKIATRIRILLSSIN